LVRRKGEVLVMFDKDFFDKSWTFKSLSSEDTLNYFLGFAEQGDGYIAFVEKICYFCDFSDVVCSHHIVNKSNGGLDNDNNKLPLCPNHHTILHKKGMMLMYNAGYYYLFNSNINRFVAFPRKDVPFKFLPTNSLKIQKNKSKINFMIFEVESITPSP
jgi:hypothetical protein